MNKIKKTIIFFAVLGLCFFTSMSGTGPGVSAEETKVVLSLWTFTDEIKSVVDRFEQQHPGIKIEVTLLPYGEYTRRLQPVLKSGEAAPDLFTSEPGSITDFMATGACEDLSAAPYKADVTDMYPFMVEGARGADGKLLALGWQVWTGGFFYRRSMAKQYLGTDDPAKVGEMLSTESKFIATGLRLKEKSQGKIKLIAGWGDYMRYALAARKKPFVDNNKHFTLDDAVVRYFAVARVLQEQKLTAGCGMWSSEWFEGMKGSNIFGYSFPLWGFTYILKTQSADTSGDWGVCRGPVPYFWGATWIGINSNSKQKEAAWEFLRFATLNKDTLEWWAQEKKECVNSKSVMNKLKDKMSDDFLAGQKYFRYFAEEALKIKGNLISAYDIKIEPLLTDAITVYLRDGGSKKQGVQEFVRNVREAFPKLIME